MQLIASYIHFKSIYFSLLPYWNQSSHPKFLMQHIKFLFLIIRNLQQYLVVSNYEGKVYNRKYIEV